MRDSWALLQLSTYVGINGYGLQYKLGAGYVGDRFRVYGYLPYFNLSLTDRGYNTPFGVESFYDFGKWQTSLNLDIYTQGTVIVPSIRVRYKIFKFKL